MDEREDFNVYYDYEGKKGKKKATDVDGIDKDNAKFGKDRSNEELQIEKNTINHFRNNPNMATYRELTSLPRYKPLTPARLVAKHVAEQALPDIMEGKDIPPDVYYKPGNFGYDKAMHSFGMNGTEMNRTTHGGKSSSSSCLSFQSCLAL